MPKHLKRTKKEETQSLKKNHPDFFHGGEKDNKEKRINKTQKRNLNKALINIKIIDTKVKN